MNGEEGAVQVLIGGDGAWEDLRQYSIVSLEIWCTRNCLRHSWCIGPMRMAYGKQFQQYDLCLVY